MQPPVRPAPPPSARQPGGHSGSGKALQDHIIIPGIRLDNKRHQMVPCRRKFWVPLHVLIEEFSRAVVSHPAITGLHTFYFEQYGVATNLCSSVAFGCGYDKAVRSL